MNAARRRILQKWRSIRWLGWWGDYLDVRFHLAEEIAAVGGSRVLDVGCGPGILLSEAPGDGSLRIGVEMDPERIATARGLCPGASFVSADWHQLPFQDKTFDLIVLGGMVELVSDLPVFLRQVWRLLDDGGYLLCTTPNRTHWMYQHHVRMRRIDEYETIFSAYPGARVQGYNPMPSPLSFLPQFIKHRFPSRWLPLIFPPSPLMARVPGIERVLRRLMAVPSLGRACKSIFISVRKDSSPQQPTGSEHGNSLLT